jgi:ubiquitin carboxyl-terminal hydrolase 25/28
MFAQLLVNVSDEGLDLYDGLGQFLDDTVEFEGRQAEMEIDILETPPILQIQLQVSFTIAPGANSVTNNSTPAASSI